MNWTEILGKILKPFLLPFALLYGMIIAVRNYFYDHNWFSSIQFSKPVISVGNLSVGGTGKTPHIEYLIELLQYQYRIATLSRGYKRKTQGFRLAEPGDTAFELGDEPAQYFAKYPEITVAVGENRILAIPQMLQKNPNIDVILLDDAFQHRSVRPGVNILITDFQKPFFKDYILPLGRLRESRSAYKRADIIIVSKCPAALPLQEKNNFIEAIQPLPHQQIFFTKIQYGVPYDLFTKEQENISKESALIVVAGIAHPQVLKNHLEGNFADVHLLDYPDHHYFHPRDIEEILQVYSSKEAKNTCIITTEKDAMRLLAFRDTFIEHKVKIMVLPIRVVFLENQNVFDQKIQAYIEKEREENQAYGII